MSARAHVQALIAAVGLHRIGQETSICAKASVILMK